ncbi:hypothetical protein [Acinetobacter indicus]|uniref:hypothetical protein n=1 Tax=Acinetobacter indicus TaxID=756892 RepID=UPI001BC8959D|nr:hypothetical protein [Acinetobacter indicus]
MAVQEQTPLREYTANGVTTSFALGFDCEETNHLIVTIDDVEVLPTDWYLSGSNVVFWTAPGNGKLIKLQRNTPFNRLADYQSYNNSFRPPAINKEFDRIWWKLQELGVADWILGNRIDALKAYVDRQDSELQQNIDNLKIYVDDKDDELRAYLLAEIQKQGVALDQLDEYYNYLMQRLAQIAIDKGWEASFVVSAGGDNQQEINDRGGSYWREKPIGYDINSRVMLDNGDIVKSTVPGNTVDPNADMTGWVNIASSNVLFNETMLSTTIRSVSSKLSDFQTLDDYGAIGDGTLKTLQHWIDTGKFSSLAAIQMVYPNATSLTESIDAVCLQAMIDSNYGKRVYIKPKHYVINKPLRITQGISLVADQRSTKPYGYTDTTAKLDFTGLVADQYAITILGDDNNKKITGVELDGFLLFGKQTVNGITIGESLQKDVTELIIRNTVCFNFKDALTTRYLYGATFDAFRAQSCVNGLLLGSQTNQVLFNRGGVVTISNNAITMSNCEGLQFNSYNISNLSKSNGAPITMYQSQAIFTNSYFELVTNPILIHVGSRIEASYSSTLVLDASLKLGESGSFHDIQVANPNAYVELRGRARFGARVVGVDYSTSHIGSIVSGDNLIMTTGTYLEDYGVGKWKDYIQYGGGVIAQELHRGFIRVTNTGPNGSGVRLSENMVTGELYTLSYAIKKTDDAQNVRLRNENTDVVSLDVSETSDSDVRIYHCSFVAAGANLRLIFTDAIDIYGYTLQKGNRRTTDLTRFALPNMTTRFVAEGIAPPTSTGWKAGDVIFSFNNTGQLGWFCTNGTLNTWVTMGIIGATKAEGLTESSTASQIVAALKTAGLAV